jgi:hypothetical protein
MKWEEAPNVKRDSSKAPAPGVKRSQNAGGKRILHIPTPDYSKMEPKIESWRRKPEVGNSDKVSVEETRNVVQI